MSWEEYGARVLKNGEHYAEYEDIEYNSIEYHGIIGSGDIKCCCIYQGLPTIYDGTDIVQYADDKDKYDYGSFDFDYKGNHFHFESSQNKDTPYLVTMLEPDGTLWECRYDYGYASGQLYIESPYSWGNIFKGALEEDVLRKNIKEKDGNNESEADKLKRKLLYISGYLSMATRNFNDLRKDDISSDEVSCIIKDGITNLQEASKFVREIIKSIS